MLQYIIRRIFLAPLNKLRAGRAGGLTPLFKEWYMSEHDEDGQDQRTSPENGEKKTKYTLAGIPLQGVELFWMCVFGVGMLFISEVTNLPGNKIIYLGIGVAIYALFRR